MSQPARLYVADLQRFQPKLIAQSCAGFGDVRLGAGRLVWAQPVFLGLTRPSANRIWALDLQTWRRSLVNADAFPVRNVYDGGSFSLDGDFATWTRGEGTIRRSNAPVRMAIVSRRLPNGPIIPLVPSAAMNPDNAGTPHVQSIGDPQRAGKLLVWVRERWNGRKPVNDLLMKNLATGHVCAVTSDAEYPVTNGRKIVWEVPTGRPWEPLVRYDLLTGDRAVLSTVANSFSGLLPSPTISGHVLAWRTFALVAGRDSYSLMARDLRTGRQYRLATGGDTAAPGTVLSGPGWGWADRVIWSQAADGPTGPQRSYLATTIIP